jgi:tRNA dimethylallyltransferase
MQNQKELPPAILLMGPTASGKSQIAMEIAEYFPIEIVSVDSAQVFRHMDIGTAKPDQETLAEVPHHLINIINPDESYSAAQFRQDALTVMHAITARNKIPLLTGGTMLYFRALLEGLSVLPPADKDLRLIIDNRAKEVGWPAMHQKLSELDQESAARIKPTDSQRIQRALEVCYLTNKPMSEILKIPTQADLPYRVINIAIQPSERSALHKRIAERFETMIAKGLIDEVQLIRKQFDVNSESPSMRCVGYRQVCLYLDDQINRSEMHDMGIAATRQLAKRQLTWLRSMKNSEQQAFDCLNKTLSNKIHTYLQTVFR